jgi:phosphoribosylformimino-5-aminoimidazole carboxamide ribotide isomerase
VRLIPSIDLQSGRSRLVFWPGAATGTGTPTDRPERIAEHFVSLGAPMLHLVDLDGAQRGVPVNTDAITAVARAVAVPLQVAGGVDGPEQIELAFAAGATRVVVPLWVVAEDDDRLAGCVRAATDWLAIGMDARADRLRDYPWRSGVAPTFDELVGRLTAAGVRRLVLSHWTDDDLPRIGELIASAGVEVQLAGGLTQPAQLTALAATGASAVIVGEALFSGAIDYAAVAP